MYSQAQREEAVAAERLLRETGANSAEASENMGGASRTHVYRQEQQQQQQQHQEHAGVSAANRNGMDLDDDAIHQQQHQQHDAEAEEAAADQHADKAAERTARRQMYPAGRILHLMPATVATAAAQQAGSSEAAQLPTGQAGIETDEASPKPLPPLSAATGSVGLGDAYVLLEVDNVEVYGRMRLCPAMVRDHFIPSYLRALDSVLGQLEKQIADGPAEQGPGQHQHVGEELLA